MSVPSYAFKGYLYYRIEKDSADVIQYFRQARTMDSLYINVPKQRIYTVDW